MFMNAVLAVALGLVSTNEDRVQVIHYKASDYKGLIGHYAQSTDSRGITHLTGFNRGRPFDVAIDSGGHVEATVGQTYVTFNVRELPKR
jgi:hypothetical protein